MAAKLTYVAEYIKFICLLLLPAVGVCLAYGQSKVDEEYVVTSFPASGLIVDSITGKGLPYVSVVSQLTGESLMTDKKGRFDIPEIASGDSLTITTMGYASKRISASLFFSGGRIPVAIEPSATQLQEVVVSKNKKPKYSKKNNPAVDLMQRIRASYMEIDPRRQPNYSFDRYEKITLGLNDFHKDKAAWLSKRLHPIEDYIDTVPMTGKPVLNLSFREKLVTQFNTASPRRTKEVIRAFRSGGIDKTFDQDNIQIMLEDVFREIDIYQNDITILQNRFVSPLSSIGADYYKYFLGDTTLIDGHRYAELIFVPHNPQSFSFNGSLLVDIDSATPFVREVSMRIPKALNLNFVKNIFVDQKFERDYMGNRHKVSDDMSVEFQIVSGVQGFYANRHIDAGHFSYDRLPDYDKFMSLEGNPIAEEGFENRSEEYWNLKRLQPITSRERAVAGLSERMDASPLFRWTRRVVQVLVKGYIPTGNPSKFDIGPVNTFISANSIEGARFRLGGMTTAALMPRLFARGYAAFGTKDHKWKYGAELEYSFTPKKKHAREFPMHSIRAEHSYDLDMLGQHYLFTNADNIFLSLKRKDNLLGTYRQLTRLSYNYEHLYGLTLQIGVKSERQTATRWLPFVDGYGTAFNHYRQSAFFIDVQYAPGATFIQTASNRLPVNMDNWTFRLIHEYGPKGLLGADFTVNKTEFSVQKRFWFSAFGYLDFMVKGGKMWSSVQYPALPWPNANLSYTIQPESYSLMNPMEFAVDTYGAWDMTYWMNGLLFNRIPYLNVLKLREVINFKGLWGHLSSRNNPSVHDSLFRFPADAAAVPMGSTPYMELSVGIDNILSILRVDYVWRLTYRHNPGTPSGGVRVALHFSF